MRRYRVLETLETAARPEDDIMMRLALASRARPLPQLVNQAGVSEMAWPSILCICAPR